MGHLLLGALLGFLSALMLRWWQYRRDFWLERVKELCKAIDDTATSGSEYWSTDASKTDPTKAHDARILGLLVRIDGFYSTLFDDAPERGELEAKLADFRDALTNGDFYGSSRVRDPDRSRLIQMHASELIVAVWRHAKDLSSTGRAIERVGATISDKCRLLGNSVEKWSKRS